MSPKRNLQHPITVRGSRPGGFGGRGNEGFPGLGATISLKTSNAVFLLVTPKYDFHLQNISLVPPPPNPLWKQVAEISRDWCFLSLIFIPGICWQQRVELCVNPVLYCPCIQPRVRARPVLAQPLLLIAYFCLRRFLVLLRRFSLAGQSQNPKHLFTQDVCAWQSNKDFQVIRTPLGLTYFIQDSRIPLGVVLLSYV